MLKLLSPWRHPVRILRAGCHVAVSMPLTIVTFTFVITFLALSVGLAPLVIVALPMAWLLFVMSRGFARLERSKIATFHGVRIPDPIPPLQRPSWFGRIFERIRSKQRWKEIAYHLVALPEQTIAFALTAAAWCGSLSLIALPAYVDALPGDSAKFYFFDVTGGASSVLAAAVGVVGIAIVAPWVTIAASRIDRGLATSLLGPTQDEAFAAERARLESNRSAAVDSAEAERRRIERDLHDGAQQRLVALAADLGVAKERLDSDPAAGRELVTRAHEEAKAALADIRDLVRGIHPVILEDRGLDAALSAIVARSPVAVTLDVDVAERPPPAVESTAYFVVAESLTNVARHSQATRARVSIARAGDRLVVEVRDDGVGGADASRGTGLQGLRDRVAGAGGSIYVISPTGGPTTISVEMPCGS